MHCKRASSILDFRCYSLSVLSLPLSSLALHLGEDVVNVVSNVKIMQKEV